LSQSRIWRIVTLLACGTLLCSALLSPLQASCAVATPGAFFDRTGKLEELSFPTLADLQARLAAVTTDAQADVFWREVIALGQMPLVFGETAVFLYRGKAATVDWIGDFTTWQTGAPLTGQRVGTTDIWTAQRRFPRDARFDYKVRIDGQRRNDPLNPITQLGGYGPSSVGTMPDYVYPQETLSRPATPKGTLSAPFVLDSKHLGYAKRVQIYTPAGYEKLRNLPVLYVTDGHEYANSAMGALPVILDNLISESKIQPVIAVFIDPRAVDTGENRRGPELLTNPNFQAFLTKELIPWVDGRYQTQPGREGRGLVGMSLGGLHATYTAMRQPQWFSFIGILSPYFKAKPAVLAEVEKSKRQDVKLFVSQGTFDYDMENTRHLKDVLKSKGYTFKYMETNDGHSWGNWRGVLDDMLTYFWGR
jgi:enterochelin esterase-like enzyme